MKKSFPSPSNNSVSGKTSKDSDLLPKTPEKKTEKLDKPSSSKKSSRNIVLKNLQSFKTTAKSEEFGKTLEKDAHEQMVSKQAREKSSPNFKNSENSKQLYSSICKGQDHSIRDKCLQDVSKMIPVLSEKFSELSYLSDSELDNTVSQNITQPESIDFKLNREEETQNYVQNFFYPSIRENSSTEGFNSIQKYNAENSKNSWLLSTTWTQIFSDDKLVINDKLLLPSSDYDPSNHDRFYEAWSNDTDSPHCSPFPRSSMRKLDNDTDLFQSSAKSLDEFSNKYIPKHTNDIASTQTYSFEDIEYTTPPSNHECSSDKSQPSNHECSSDKSQPSNHEFSSDKTQSLNYECSSDQSQPYFVRSNDQAQPYNNEWGRDKAQPYNKECDSDQAQPYNNEYHCGQAQPFKHEYDIIQNQPYNDFISNQTQPYNNQYSGYQTQSSNNLYSGYQTQPCDNQYSGYQTQSSNNLYSGYQTQPCDNQYSGYQTQPRDNQYSGYQTQPCDNQYSGYQTQPCDNQYSGYQTQPCDNQYSGYQTQPCDNQYSGYQTQPFNNSFSRGLADTNITQSNLLPVNNNNMPQISSGYNVGVNNHFIVPIYLGRPRGACNQPNTLSQPQIGESASFQSHQRFPYSDRPFYPPGSKNWSVRNPQQQAMRNIFQNPQPPAANINQISVPSTEPTYYQQPGPANSYQTSVIPPLPSNSYQANRPSPIIPDSYQANRPSITTHSYQPNRPSITTHSYQASRPSITTHSYQTNRPSLLSPNYVQISAPIPVPTDINNIRVTRPVQNRDDRTKKPRNFKNKRKPTDKKP